MEIENLQIQDMYIVLVEHSSMQLKIISQQFEALGINNVQTASNGNDALAIIQSNIPDLVIASMYLPDMTSIELVNALRDNSRTESVPFMLISSETSFKALDPIRQAGVVAILPKPFQATDLKRALLTSLDFINVSEELEEEEIDIGELKVLLVDDSATARKHISRVLSNLGILNIQEAVNGKDAVSKIDSSFFDLVVTDYNMPEMDGQELTQYIRNESSQRSIPIIMVTSENDENRLSGVQQAGVSGICDKPFEPKVVKEYLKNILQEI